MPPQAEGYVQPYGPFRGDAQTLFTLNTEDKAYIAASLGNWLQLRLQGINGGSPISDADALVNADNFAGAAMNIT